MKKYTIISKDQKGGILSQLVAEYRVFLYPWYSFFPTRAIVRIILVERVRRPPPVNRLSSYMG